MPIPIVLDFEKTGTNNKVHQISYPEPLRFVSARVSASADVTEDLADYATFKILGNDQATVVAQYSTQTSADGTLSAGVPAALTNQNPDKTIYDANERIEISVTKTGASGVDVDATITAFFEVARSY